jgi:phosphoribosyl-AMP cyclohydrolase
VSEDRAGAGLPFAVAFDDAGLVSVVAQEGDTGAVLLLAWMNAEALARTLEEGMLVFWSRSRQTLWRKGEHSGNTLRLRELRVNCEGNSLLALVELQGTAACHEGYRSCYYRRLDPADGGAFTAQIIAERQFDPEVVYGGRR